MACFLLKKNITIAKRNWSGHFVPAPWRTALSKVHLSSKVFFNRRSFSIKECLLSEVAFQQSLGTVWSKTEIMSYSKLVKHSCQLWTNTCIYTCTLVNPFMTKTFPKNISCMLLDYPSYLNLKKRKASMEYRPIVVCIFGLGLQKITRQRNQCININHQSTSKLLT